MLTALGVVLAALLGAGAAVTHLAAGQRQAAAATARLHRVEALVQSTDRKAEAVVRGRTVHRADASWTYPGTQHNTGRIDVPRTAGPGTAVGIWVDQSGRPATAPPSAIELSADAACLGLLVFGLLGVLASALLSMRLTVLDRRADRAWTLSWARSEPVWSGRGPRGSEHG